MTVEEARNEIVKGTKISSVINDYIKFGSKTVCDCPFCKENNSFAYSDKKERLRCFCCGAEDDIVGTVSRLKNISIKDACIDIGKKTGQIFNFEYTKEEEEIYFANKTAAIYFMSKLKETPMAVELFRKRGLNYNDTVRFGLGYDDNSRNGLQTYLIRHGVSEETAVKAGLLTRNSSSGLTYDKFRNRLMFPIINKDRRIIGFGGRKTQEYQEAKYLNTAETPVFHKRESLYGINIAGSNCKNGLILCEGYMDAISLQKAGFENTVAPLGTAFSKPLADMIRDYTDKVYLCFDSDTAGEKAKIRAINILNNSGIEVKVPDIKPYKDPDELIQAEGRNGFERALKNAVSSAEFETTYIYEHEGKNADSKFYERVMTMDDKSSEIYIRAKEEIEDEMEM